MRVASGVIELVWKGSGSRLTTAISNIGTIQENKDRDAINITFKSGGSMTAVGDYDQIIRLVYNPHWITISEQPVETKPTRPDYETV